MLAQMCNFLLLGIYKKSLEGYWEVLEGIQDGVGLGQGLVA